jgi:hypothetical protein
MKYVKLAAAAVAVWYLFLRQKPATGSTDPQGKVNQPQPGVVRGAA